MRFTVAENPTAPVRADAELQRGRPTGSAPRSTRATPTCSSSSPGWSRPTSARQNRSGRPVSRSRRPARLPTSERCERPAFEPAPRPADHRVRQGFAREDVVRRSRSVSRHPESRLEPERASAARADAGPDRVGVIGSDDVRCDRSSTPGAQVVGRDRHTPIGAEARTARSADGRRRVRRRFLLPLLLPSASSIARRFAFCAFRFFLTFARRPTRAPGSEHRSLRAATLPVRDGPVDRW